MRKLIIALAATLVATFAPTAASAQSLQDILGVVQAGTAYGYNSCSYVTGGVGKVACQANRAVTVANTLADIKRRRDYQRSDDFNKRTRQLEALQRACKAGDSQSCARSGGASPQQMEVARALMDACTSGDRASCARAEGMMDERNVSSYAYQDQPRSQRQQVAQRENCQPVIDSVTGYRIVGQFRCN